MWSHAISKTKPTPHFFWHLKVWQNNVRKLSSSKKQHTWFAELRAQPLRLCNVQAFCYYLVFKQCLRLTKQVCFEFFWCFQLKMAHYSRHSMPKVLAYRPLIHSARMFCWNLFYSKKITFGQALTIAFQIFTDCLAKKFKLTHDSSQFYKTLTNTKLYG